MKCVNRLAKNDPTATRDYSEHYVNSSGRITRPVLTLHTTGDALATPNHESAYRVAVEHQGNGDLARIDLFSLPRN